LKDFNSYIDQKQKQLDQWKLDLHDLEKQAKAATADARKEMQDRIETFQNTLKQAETRLSSLRTAAADSRDTLKQSVETAWTDLQKAAVHAKERLTEAVTA